MNARTPEWLKPGLSLLCLLIIALAILRVAWSAYAWDSTYDEYWHLLWSERALLNDNFDREYGNFISTTPVSMLNAAAKALAQQSGIEDYTALTKVARIPTVIAFVVLLAVVFLAGRTLLGSQAGLLAATLTALDPNLSTHAALTTVDIYFAIVTFCFVIQCIRFLDNPSLPQVVLLAVVTGVGFIVKLTTFLFLPVLVLILPIALSMRRADQLLWRLPLYMLLGTAIVFLIIGAGYKFEGFGFYLGQPVLYSSFMRGLADSLPFLYLPLPEAFISGFDQTLSVERNMQWNTVIFDRYFSDGLWYYFPVTWVLKTPIAVLALLTIAVLKGVRIACQALASPARDGGLIRMFTPGNAALLPLALLVIGVLWLLFFIYFNFIFRTHVGLRYILMSLPLVYLVLSLSLAFWMRIRQGRVVIACLLLLAVIEQLPFWNNSLSFSNQIVFDKKNAYHVLTDSNIDWGQNYSRVMAMAAAEYPEAVINPPHILPGLNIIRLNFLAGVFRNWEQHRWVREHLEPEQHLLHTHLLYDVPDTRFSEFLDAENRLQAAAVESNCDAVIDAFPYRINAAAVGSQWLCIESPPTDIQVEVLSGRGGVGGNPDVAACQDYQLLSGQKAVFRLTNARSRLCLLSEEANTVWQLSRYE